MIERKALDLIHPVASQILSIHWTSSEIFEVSNYFVLRGVILWQGKCCKFGDVLGLSKSGSFQNICMLFILFQFLDLILSNNQRTIYWYWSPGMHTKTVNLPVVVTTGNYQWLISSLIRPLSGAQASNRREPFSQSPQRNHFSVNTSCDCRYPFLICSYPALLLLAGYHPCLERIFYTHPILLCLELLVSDL